MTLENYLTQQGHGSKSELALKIQVSPQAISKWLKGKKISAEMAVQIFFVTEGEVGLADMRPDLFPPQYVLVHINDVKKNRMKKIKCLNF